MYRQPYGKVVSETVHATKEVGRMINDVWERGMWNSIKDVRQARRDRYHEMYGKANAAGI